ncbi:hypothetical protein ASZ90_013054 [hydrocarbon metagenome]|uniref:Uncharacterized protein n=1 Tax=hydrocarbon metagenome TaxID=938273 RepID=A0A0W8F9F7_9ZZZZ
MNVLSAKCGQVTGVLEQVRPVAGDIVADFRCKCPHCGQPETVSVAFPGRAREKIEAYVGQRITVLRNGEDYLVRVVAEAAHLPQEVSALAGSCLPSTLSDGSRSAHLIGTEDIIRLQESGIVAGRLNAIIGPGLVQIEDLRIEVPPDMWVSTGDPRALLGKRVWLAVVNGQHRLAEMTLRGD